VGLVCPKLSGIIFGTVQFGRGKEDCPEEVQIGEDVRPED